MVKKLVVPLAVFASMAWSQAYAADQECKTDKDCKEGQVCILVLTPPVCKPPQPAGQPCKRDVVCASKKCDIPAGKDAGVCK